MADVLGEVVVRAVVDYGGLADDLIGGVDAAADEAAASLTATLDGAGEGVEATLAEAGSEGGQKLARGVESGADAVDVDLTPGLAGMEGDAARAGETAGDALAGGFDEVPGEIDATLAGAAPDLSDEFATSGAAAGDALSGGFDGVPGEIDATLAGSAPDLSGEFAATGAVAGDALTAGFDDVPAGMAASAAAGEAAVEGELDSLGGIGQQAGEDAAEGVGAGFVGNIDSIRGPLSTALAGIAALISGVLIAGIVQSAELDAQLREVVTLFGETGAAAEASLDRLQPQVRALSNEIGFATDELTGGLYNAISAGVPEENAFTFLQTAGEFAVAGVTDVGTAIEGLTSATNAFNLDIADASDTADTFFAGVQAGKTTVPELSDALFQVAPAASAAGLALDETVAATAALTASGVPTSVATTQIRGAIVELSDAGSAVGAVFEEVAGVTFRDFIASGGDLAGALAILQGEAASTGDQVGDYFGSVEAAAAAQTLATDSSGAYAAALEFQAERAGAAGDAFDLVNASAARQFDLLKVQAANIASTVGDVFEPALAAALDVALGFGGVLQEMPGWMTAVIAVGGTLAATIAAIGAASLLAGPKIAAVNASFVAMGGASGVAAAGASGLLTVLNRTALFLTGPWGVALAAAGAGFTVFNRHQEDARQVAERLAAELADTPGALSRVSDEMLLNTLKAKDVEDAWAATGLELETLRGAMQGNAEDAELVRNAMDKVKDPLEVLKTLLPRVRDEKRDLSHTIHDLLEGTEDYTDALDPLERATGAVRAATRGGVREFTNITDGILGAGEASETAAGGVEELADEMDDATSAGQKLLDAMNELDGGTVDLARSSVNYHETVEALTESLAENGATTDVRTEKGRTNISVLLDAVDATRRHISAMVDAGASQEHVNYVTGEHINQLRGVMQQAGFTDQQINTLLDRYGLIPGEITTQVEAAGVETALQQTGSLEATLERLGRTTYSAYVEVRSALAGGGYGGSQGRAHGGPVWPDHWYLVGEEGPELLAATQPGMVYPADTTADVLAAMMTPDARALPGGGTGGFGGGGASSSLTVNTTIYATEPHRAGRDVVRELRDAVYLGGPLAAGRGRH